MTEELLQLRLVTSRLQLIQDLCKAIVAHLGEGLRRQLTVWSRAASLAKQQRTGRAGYRSGYQRPRRARLGLRE